MNVRRASDTNQALERAQACTNTGSGCFGDRLEALSAMQHGVGDLAVVAQRVRVATAAFEAAQAGIALSGATYAHVTIEHTTPGQPEVEFGQGERVQVDESSQIARCAHACGSAAVCPLFGAE